jgi:hypothetical protein
VAVLLQRDDGGAVLMGMHRHGEFAGSWGIPSATLRESDRPQALASKLAVAATCGVLGNALSVRTAWNSAKTGRALCMGDTLVYTIAGLPASTAETLGGVIEHASGCFAQAFDSGTQELLQCPVGLLPFRRVQWREWCLGMEQCSKWDPYTLEVMRRMCASHGPVPANK